MKGFLGAAAKVVAHDTKTQYDGVEAAIAKTNDVCSNTERAKKSRVEQIRLTALLMSLTLIDDSQDGFEENFSASDTLDALIIKELDHDDDGDVEDSIKDEMMDHVSDVFETLGVSSIVIDEMMDDDTDISDSAIESACEIALSNLPADAKLNQFITDFVFGDDEDEDEDETQNDSVQFDGKRNKKKRKLTKGKRTKKKNSDGQTLIYKAKQVFRDGKVKIVNKRISGNYKLTAAQKTGLAKLHGKSRTKDQITSSVKNWKKGRDLGFHGKHNK